MKCLAHLTGDDLAMALAAIGRDRDVDARGVAISSQLLQRILDVVREAPNGLPRFGRVDFQEATFEDARFDDAIFEREALFNRATFKGNGARFVRATFEGGAEFDEATFHGNASFDSVTFNGDARFAARFEWDAWFQGATFRRMARFHGANFKANARLERATFKDEASFSDVAFHADAWFSQVTFERDAWLQTATFQEDAWFDEATFQGNALCGWATFQRSANFDRAIFAAEAQFFKAAFEGRADFGRATFRKGADFEETIFREGAAFQRATFERARELGPMLALGELRFDEALFLQPTNLSVSANRLSMAGARLPEGGQIGVRWAEVALDNADFGKPTVLSAAPRFGATFKERKLARALKREGERSTRSGRPRVVSLRQASVRNVTLSNVNLKACRFVGAHDLDQLRIDGRSTFAPAPAGWRATRRLTIAEEHDWRARRLKRWWHSPGWLPTDCQFPEWLGDAGPCEPDDIAAIYRELRKGREDTKNEPGAADFYYGEMEMRKLDKTKPRAERSILWLYWLVSGYGLRASRALLSLLVTVFVFGVLLYAWGFPSHASFLDAVTFSAESTTSLFRPPQRELTLAGEWLQIGLRLLGPLFFGLALLSLRGRVKR